MSSLRERLTCEVYALPVDLFRIAVGGLCFVYFIRLLLEVPDYTAHDGFLDHNLVYEIFFFASVSVFQPWMSDWMFYALLAVGLLCTVGIIAGRQPKWCAFFALVIAVSNARYNFAVINIDDTSIHLWLLWMMLLPVGHTLVAGSGRSLVQEARVRVEGFTLRCLYANLFIYYLVAGLTKLKSELWREGYALYVSLRLPLARTTDWWDVSHLEFLWLFNHLTLLLEPLFPFIILLPKNHPLKWAGGIAWMSFHLGIAFSIGVPYANLGLVLVLILVFREEIMDLVRRRVHIEASHVEPAEPSPVGIPGRVAVVFLLLLALSMSKGVPGLEKGYEAGYIALYVGGVAQEYHLFDWIDSFNYHSVNQVKVTPEGGSTRDADPKQLFPPTVRGAILQSYFYPMRWVRVPLPLSGKIRRSVLRRAGERFARKLEGKGTVEVLTTVQRIDKDNLLIDKGRIITLMKFDYADGRIVRFQELY